ncbi:hypothetical protein B5181_17930 [Streptomyces sp. 4F]|nr:hypothetical protein B5181_17930 [Streptomyces sp. 4F]
MTQETTTLTGQSPPPVRDWPALDLDGPRFDPVPADLMREGPLTRAGAVLARMQTELLVDTLLERLPGLRLAVRAEQVEWRRKTMVRGPRTLPCTW